MRYLSSILRIIVLVAVVLAIANFSDIQKVKAVSCTLNGGNLQTSCLENMDVTITGGVVVTNGFHTYNSLTINGGGVLTHDALTPGEDGATSTKKVDLNITNDLNIQNGSIDVSGNGYRGGVLAHKNGYGTGGGKFIPSSRFSGGGGGGYGANGGNSYQEIPTSLVSGGISYGNAADPNDYGSGGSGSEVMNLDQYFYPGGSGGGLIRITAKNIHLPGTGSIKADGTNTVNGLWVSGGAGAGGSINIIVKDTLYTNIDSSKKPLSEGGTAVNSGGNNSPVFLNSNNHDYDNIEANGGDADIFNSGSGDVGGGGGAGGRIFLNIGNVQSTCYIAGSQTSIPAFCEGKDVTIDGATVNADAVQVGTEGKRNFTNLTIENSGVLTHNALIPTTDFSTSTTTPNPLTLTGQLKKVDLIIDNDLTLESGGKINVDGKGYPNNYGPGHGSVGMCPDAKGCAGGGGYGGKGGQGDTTNLIGGLTYGLAAEPINFGSGAGLSNCGNDFFGGGRIKIDAGSITISDLSSMITANGNNDNNNCNFSPGGPSGGSIWLLSNTITTPVARPDTSSDYAMADKGYHLAGRGTDGFVGTLRIDGVLRNNGNSYNPNVLSYTNIFAKGGDIWRNGGAGGGGRIVLGAGTTSSGIQSRKVTVTVAWKENGIDKSVKLYSVLRSVVPTP